MARAKTTDRDAESSPLLWFGWMLAALDRGDYARAADCQAELNQLGWRVSRIRDRKPAGKGVAR